MKVRQVLDASIAGHSDAKSCTVLKVDGGMTANSLLMQFQADVLGVCDVLYLCAILSDTYIQFNVYTRFH